MNQLRGILLVLMGFVTVDVCAQEAPPSPGLVNVFACKLNDGKSLADVWSTLEALARMNVPSKAGPDPAGNVFLWTPFRGGAPYDYVWGYGSTDLDTMGQDLVDYLAAPGSEAMEMKFAATGQCISMIATSKVLRAGTLGNSVDRNPDAVVETFACSYKDAAGVADLDKVVAAWQSEVEKMGSPALKTYAAWLWTPFRGGTGESDYIWVGAYPDVANWAQGDTAFYASKEGRAIDARFNAMGKCRSNLWAGYWIIAPSTPTR